MFHIFSLVCFLIYGVKSRSGHDRSQSFSLISHESGPKLSLEYNFYMYKYRCKSVGIVGSGGKSSIIDESTVAETGDLLLFAATGLHVQNRISNACGFTSEPMVDHPRVIIFGATSVGKGFPSLPSAINLTNFYRNLIKQHI